MHIETRSLSEIKPYPDNPRVNDDAVTAVAKSIRAFGFKVPILVDATGVIIAGHTRLKAARALGLTEVPVIVAADLTPEQARALRIADNQTGTLAEWDLERLRVELRSLADLGCDLNVLGFGEQLDAMLAAAAEADPPEDPGEDGDGAPTVSTEAKSRVGEVYALGRHRLLCGDATDPADVARLLAGDAADLLMADPPYAADHAGGDKPKRPAFVGEVPAPEDFGRFLLAAFRAANAALRPGAPVYVWQADRDTAAFMEAFQSVRWEMVQCLEWVKGVFSLGRQDYQWRHESCLYGNKPGAMRPWFGEGTPGSVLLFRTARSAEHPTLKPIDLFAFQMANSCPPGGLVLDPFAGSGTTALAAERLGMRARLLELSPQYADVTRRRWTGFVYGPDADWEALTPPATGGTA